MGKQARALLTAALVAALALPGGATHVLAEPSEPARWVKTSSDSVIAADALGALRAAGDQYEALTSGDGFYAFDRNMAEYTLRLVTSGEGDIEIYRNELQQTANEINAQSNIRVTVAPGTVPGPADPLYLSAADGEIWVMIASSSGCGTLAGGTLGCGGTDGYDVVNGEFRLSAGIVWLSPTMQTKCQQAVTSHEVGHALGLSHFDAKYLNEYQIMRSSTACTFSNYRAGDVNGLRYLSEATAASNDNVAAADLVCPLKDSTMSASTWFASAEPGEPAHAGSGPRRSVWFQYAAQQSGSTTIKTTNDGTEDFDTVLAVYTGSMFAGVVPVASNDDFTGVLSQVTFNAVAGTTYWIAVDGKGTARGETDVVFDLPPTVPPPAIAAGVPTRFLDSRRPGGQTFDCGDQAVGRIAAGTTYQLQVQNRAFVTSATSVIMNVTVVAPDAAGYVTVFPCGATQPNASNLNFVAGDVIPNLVIAKVGTGGKVCFFTSATTDLIVDVSNFFVAASGLTALAAPAQLMDTRAGGATVDGQSQATGQLAPNVPYELLVGGRAGVTAGAATAVLNVTAVGPAGGGYVTVYPCGVAPPNASNLNFAAGDTIPNLVLAKIGTGGGANKVCFVSSVATDLLVDVSGFFLNALTLAPLTPARLLDTRNPGSPTVDGLHQGVGRLAAGATYQLPVWNRGGVNANTTAVVLNVTAVGPNAGGYLTVYPCGSTQPNASNLNFAAGDVIPNSVIAKTGTGGNVCIFSSADVDLLVDVSGYFIP